MGAGRDQLQSTANNLGQPGGILEKEAALQISNVAIFNPVSNAADRVGIQESDDGAKNSPLSKIDQMVNFMLSSGAGNQDFLSNIVPEPGTGLLLALGLSGLAIASRRRS